MSDQKPPAQPIGYYLCTTEVALHKSREFFCIVFTSGHVYPLLRFEYKDAVLVNDAGGEHLMPPAMLEKRFRLMSADYVPEVKETNDGELH